MGIIWKIISKNFKLLTRSKASSLIVIFGPLLLIFLVGIAFDTSNTYNINIGIYSEQFSNVTDSFIEKLNKNNFKVHKYDLENECVEDIRTGRVHTCVVFPPNMEFKTGVTNEMIFHIDYSKIHLVWIILDTISTQLTATKSEISEGLTNILLSKLQDVNERLDEKKAVLSDLKAKTNDIETAISKIKGDLGGLDLSINKESFRVSDIKSQNDNLKEIVYSMSTDTKARISEMRKDLDTTKTKVSNLNMTEEEEDLILNKIDLIKGNLNGVSYKLNRTVNRTEEGWENMSDHIFFLEQSLNEITLNLDKAVKTRSLTSSSIDEMSQKLNESLDALNSIEQTFSYIDTNIASIQVTSAKDIVNPITTTIKPVTQQKTQLNYLFPSLMVLVIMFISILLSTTIIMMEKHSPAHFRNFITPINDVTFVLGTYFTNMILVISQLVIILFVSSIFFKTQIISNLPMIAGFLLIITSLFTLIGMVVGHLFESEETATLAAVSVGTIFLLLSSTILPLETMPAYVGEVAQYNPFVVSVDVLRKAILFAPPIETFLDEAKLLVSYSLVLFLIAWVLQNNYKRNYLRMVKKKILAKRKKRK